MSSVTREMMPRNKVGFVSDVRVPNLHSATEESGCTLLFTPTFHIVPPAAFEWFQLGNAF